MKNQKTKFDINPLVVILVLLAIYYLLPPILFGFRYALAEKLNP